MYPQSYEIDEVGNAFIALSTPAYTPPQHIYLIRYLQQYALDFNEPEIQKIFSDKLQAVDALKALNHFSNHLCFFHLVLRPKT